MRLESNVDYISMKHRSRSKLFGPVMLEAENEFARMLLNEARRLSHGMLTSQMLRYRDHPYARRHPRGEQLRAGNRGPNYQVNKQTGRFYEGWISYARPYLRRITVTLKNRAPHARWFNGQPTSRMIARPIVQRVWKNLRGARRNLLARARRRISRGEG